MIYGTINILNSNTHTLLATFTFDLTEIADYESNCFGETRINSDQKKKMFINFVNGLDMDLSNSKIRFYQSNGEISIQKSNENIIFMIETMVSSCSFQLKINDSIKLAFKKIMEY